MQVLIIYMKTMLSNFCKALLISQKCTWTIKMQQKTKEQHMVQTFLNKMGYKVATGEKKQEKSIMISTHLLLWAPDT